MSQNSTSVDIEKLQSENKALKKSIEDLWTINQLARIIGSTMPVNVILDKVVSVSVKAIHATQGTIHLLEEKTTADPFKTLVRKADQTHFTKKYRLDQDLSGWMLKNRKSLLINDFKNENPFKNVHAHGDDINSLLSVPLLCKGKLIGVLNLYNKKANGDEGVFSSNDQRLLSIIASQSAQVIENARLYEKERQLVQLERDMEAARAIQHQLLPKTPPEITGFDMAGVSYAAKEVGGDYFDFIELQENKWMIALGDVSGKGIAAALLMSSLQATLRNQALSASSLVECIEKSNQFLFANTESTKFVTMFSGILNASKSSFTYVNAGHNYPFYLHKSGKSQALEDGGLMLGIVPETQYSESEILMSPGEILVIYSDGVTEAEDKSEELFGEERLQQVIEENKSLSAKELIDKIYNAVEDYSVPGQQDDDITLVVIKKT